MSSHAQVILTFSEAFMVF